MTPEVTQRLKEINVDVKDGDVAEDDDLNIRTSETCGRSAAWYSQLQSVDCSRRTDNSAHHEDRYQGRKWSMDRH